MATKKKRRTKTPKTTNINSHLAGQQRKKDRDSSPAAEKQQQQQQIYKSSSLTFFERNKKAIFVALLLSIGIPVYYYDLRYENVDQEISSSSSSSTSPSRTQQEEQVQKSQEEESRISSRSADSTYAEAESNLVEPKAPKPAAIRRETLFLGDDSFEVLEVLPHDKKAFTQGLTLYNGFLYEGTGLYGSSEIRKIDPSNPSISLLKSQTLSSKYFGEGITYYTDKDGNNPRFIQLTWKEKTAFIYDANTLDVIQEFEYDTTNSEGWGITFLSETCEFVVSDGSQFLIFWDCQSFEETRRVEVKYYRDNNEDEDEDEKAVAIKMLNELEVIKLKDGRYAILANVWFQDVLLQIDPLDGGVDKIYYFNSLNTNNRKGRGGDDVFNGISICDENDDIIYLTGKMWSHMYKVRLIK